MTDDTDEIRDDLSEAIEILFNDKVSVTAPTSILATIGSVFGVIELFLAGIAGISLLVAGIGIMNIMIVSLMERTREIGILKALGMQKNNVLLVFLTEAVIIGILGGMIGVGLGYILSIVMGQVISGFSNGGFGGDFGGPPGAASFSINPVVTIDLALAAIGFGLIVSVVFALYPAWRAARLEPVDALRYE
jgi:putative ABC transport system permease protein